MSHPDEYANGSSDREPNERSRFLSPPRDTSQRRVTFSKSPIASPGVLNDVHSSPEHRRVRMPTPRPTSSYVHAPRRSSGMIGDCHSDVAFVPESEANPSALLPNLLDPNGNQPPEKKFSRIVQGAMLLGTVVAYTLSPFFIDLANKIPSVQFDFHHGTTLRDLYRPKTLTLRKRCGSNTRSNGGFEFLADKGPDACWNGYLEKDVWTVERPRLWAGWLKPAPFMDTVSVLVRIAGDVRVDMKISEEQGTTQQIRVESQKGVEKYSDAIKDINLSAGDAAFDVEVTFLDEESVQDPGNKISFLYYVGDDVNLEKAVLLPYSEYTEKAQIQAIAESDTFIDGVDARDLKVHPPKGRKFIPMTVIFFWWSGVLVGNFIVCCLMDLYYKYRKIESEFSWVRACFEWKNAYKLYPAGVCWATADICEVLALGKLDPVIYTVMSQMRMLGTAALSTIFLGRKYTTLQWVVLGTLTLLVISFSILSSGGQGSAGFIGYFLAAGKFLLSILAAVYSEKALTADRPFFVQAVWIASCVIPTISLSFFIMMWNPDLNIFENGFFGGYDFGWDVRTVMLICFYMFYCMVPTGCVKVTSALSKNICNAGSMLTVFFLYAIIYQKKPDMVRVVLCFTILMAVFGYVLSKEYLPKASLIAALELERHGKKHVV